MHVIKLINLSDFIYIFGRFFFLVKFYNTSHVARNRVIGAPMCSEQRCPNSPSVWLTSSYRRLLMLIGWMLMEPCPEYFFACGSSETKVSPLSGYFIDSWQHVRRTLPYITTTVLNENVCSVETVITWVTAVQIVNSLTYNVCTLCILRVCVELFSKVKLVGQHQCASFPHTRCNCKLL